MSGKVGNHFYCIFCDVKFKSEADFNTHCNGKKHKNNERIKTEQDAAEASVLVRGAKGCKNLEQFLASYFCQFGLLAKISALGPVTHGIAKVQFAQPEFAASVLSAGPVHKHCGLSLRVSKFEYKPHGGDAMRVAAREEMHREKGAREELHNKIMHILAEKDSVESQLSALTENLQLSWRDLLDRQQIVCKLKEVFSVNHPGVSVYQFGSSINRFGTCGCDLDLFLDIDLEKPVSNKQMKNLHKILSARHLATTFTDILLVPSHRCPIIKFTHKQTGIKCDLSLNNKKALFNTLLLRLYASDKRVRHVVYALRLWAKFRGLSGGVGASAPTVLSSYALTLLALFYLMRCSPEPVLPAVCDLEKCVPGITTETVEESQCLIVPEDVQLPPSKNTQTSAELLVGFFKFYNEEIKWSQDAILMKDASTTPRATLMQNFSYLKCKLGAMTVIDPFNLSHNVAGNVNESFIVHLTEEIKRAEKLSSHWLEKSSSESGKDIDVAHGLQDLFELLNLDEQKQLNHNDKSNKKSGAESGSGKGKKSKSKNKNPVRMEGEQENGDFHIILPLSQATLESKLLREEAQSTGLSPGQCWLNKARDLTLNVLENVFLTELEVKEGVKGGSEEKVRILKEESERTSKDSHHQVNTAVERSIEKGERSTGHWYEAVEEMETEVESGGQEASCQSKKRSCENVHPDMEESGELSCNQSRTTETVNHNVEINNEKPLKRLCVDGTPESLSRLRSIDVPIATATVATTVFTASSCTTTTTTITVSSTVSSKHASTVLCTSSSTLTKANMRSKESQVSEHSTSANITFPQQSLFWCKCQHPVWHGRKKLKQEVLQQSAPMVPSELDLEIKITNKYLKQEAASSTKGFSPVKHPDVRTTNTKPLEECRLIAAETKPAAKETGVSLSQGIPAAQNNAIQTDIPQAMRIPLSTAGESQNAVKSQVSATATSINVSQATLVASRKTIEGSVVEKTAPSCISQALISKGTDASKCSPHLKNQTSQFHSNLVDSGTNLERLTNLTGNAKLSKLSKMPVKAVASSGPASVSFQAQNLISKAEQSISIVPNSTLEAAKATCIDPNHTSNAVKPTVNIQNPDSKSKCLQPAARIQSKKPKKTVPIEEDSFCLRFSCELFLNKGEATSTNNDSSPQPPTHLLIKLRPAKDPKHFKVFYDSFRSIMIRLNSTELNLPS